MGPLKLYWTHPVVEFNGRGVSEAWADAMARIGFEFTDRPEEADCAVFISDSQMNDELLGLVPTVGYFWGYPPTGWLHPGADGFARRQAHRMAQCDALLVPSWGTWEQLLMLGGGAAEILPAGVDNVLLDSGSGLINKKHQVLFLSRLAPHKGLVDLIQAMSLLDPRVPLVVSGPGDRTEYQELAERLQVPVTFNDFSDREKAQAYRDSAVLVHPSGHEGFGMTPLEALYVGTPVIVRNTPHNIWMLRNAPFYFDRPEDLAMAIIAVLNGTNGVAENTAWGQQHVRANYTLDVAAQRLAHAIHEAIRTFCGRAMREHPENAETIYDRDHRRNWFFRAQNADPTWSRHWRAQHLIGELKAANAHVIIDIGCGLVYPSIFALAGFQVTAYDHSGECLKQAAEVAAKWGVGDRVVTVKGKAEALGYEDNTFDGAVLGEILEHVQYPEAVLDEAFRVVRPGGVVTASTPCGAHHHDPLHMGPHEGGWDDESLDRLLVGYDVVTRKTIAEEGTDPSCYLFTVKKS